MNARNQIATLIAMASLPSLAMADSCVSPIEHVQEIKTPSGVVKIHVTYVSKVPGCGFEPPEAPEPVEPLPELSAEAPEPESAPIARPVAESKPKARKRPATVKKARRLPCRAGRFRNSRGICGRWGAK